MLHLKQVLINLVKNSIKFALYGDISVLMAFDKSRLMLEVRVVDTGIGIC